MAHCKQCGGEFTWGKGKYGWIKLALTCKVAVAKDSQALTAYVNGQLRILDEVRLFDVHKCVNIEEQGLIEFTDPPNDAQVAIEIEEEKLAAQYRLEQIKRELDEQAKQAKRDADRQVIIQRCYNTEQRRDALQSECPTCSAPAGEPCHAAKPYRYGSIYIQNPHHLRMKLAALLEKPQRIVPRIHTALTCPEDLQRSGLTLERIRDLDDFLANYPDLFSNLIDDAQSDEIDSS